MLEHWWRIYWQIGTKLWNWMQIVIYIVNSVKCGPKFGNVVKIIEIWSKTHRKKEETFDNCAQCTLYIYYYSSLAVTLIWIYHQRGTSPPLAEYCPCRQAEIFIIFLFWQLRISTRFPQVLKVFLLQKDKISEKIKTR